MRSGKRVGYARSRVWFERWIREGYSIRQLSHQSGLSEWKLRDIIHYWLDRPPDCQRDLTAYRYLIIDSTYLQGRKTATTAIMDTQANTLVSGVYGMKEGEAAMRRFCSKLRSHGLCPHSVTIDGNPLLLAMLKEVWPNAVIQRCLVHIQRQGLSWCRRNPKTADARLLRQLFLRVTNIYADTQREDFLSAWQAWEDRYGHRIARTPERGWVFSDLKRARSMLARALPYMFRYLEDPNIPRSTNVVEGYFGRLKPRYHQHRGLAEHRRASYFTWYFHLCR